MSYLASSSHTSRPHADPLGAFASTRNTCTSRGARPARMARAPIPFLTWPISAEARWPRRMNPALVVIHCCGGAGPVRKGPHRLFTVAPGCQHCGHLL